MANQISQCEEFKSMLDQRKFNYIELPQSTLIIKSQDEKSINIRLYSDEGFCLSSWVNIDEFKEKIGGLINDGKAGI